MKTRRQRTAYNRHEDHYDQLNDQVKELHKERKVINFRSGSRCPDNDLYLVR
jgi:uncharacterized coiled-coil DUF342 family protein